MTEDQADEFLRKAQEAETNANWASDADLRQRWKEVAGTYRRLEAKIEREAQDCAINLACRKTA